MFRESIKGLDQILESEPPGDSVVVISGAAGTVKSGFCFQMMANQLRDHPEQAGLYMTLEEAAPSHMRNMVSLGIDLPENLFLSDYNGLRQLIGATEKQNIFASIEALLRHHREERGENFQFFALDSLNALYHISGSEEAGRSQIYDLFNLLRELKLTAFMILESSRIDAAERPEGFLADGIIELSRVSTREDVLRAIQIYKWRGCSHRMERFSFQITPEGMQIIGKVYQV